MKNKFKPKIISGIMAGTMLVCNAVPAYAANWEVEGEEALSGTEITAVVTYNPNASFMVSVPKNIALDAGTKSAEYGITVKGGIETGTEVVVAPKDSVPDTDGVNFYMSDKSVYKKGNVVATVTQESTEWSASEVTESGTTKKGTILARDLSYGDWSGNLSFMINLCGDHEHNYENGTCTECGKADPDHEHGYTETVTREATCTEAGEKTLACVCGESKTESIPAAGHNYENGSCTECGETDAVPTIVGFEDGAAYMMGATLSVKQGETLKINDETVADNTYTFDKAGEYKITVVGENGKEITINITIIINQVHTHKYTETVTKEPTCTEAGEKTLICDCGDSKTESIPATGHNYEDGSCTECGEADPSHEHDYTEAVTKEATCTEDGEKTLTCVCGDTKTESIPATGHDYESGRCKNCGEEDGTIELQIAPQDEIDNWNYTLDEDNNTITLVQYINDSNTDVTVYDAYPYDGKVYRTKIASYTDSNYMFRNKTKISRIVFSKYVNSSDTTDMSCMFDGCSSLTYLDIAALDTHNVQSMYAMFNGCCSLTGLDLSTFDTSNVTSMSTMFDYCPKLTKLDVSSFDTGKVTNMACMFETCRGLTSLDISNFDTGNVTKMAAMFRNCSGLTKLDLSNFNTGSVETMNLMFNACTSLKELNLSSFDTSCNVTTMARMFDGCTSLTSLDCNFNTSSVETMISMFEGCTSLKELDLTSFDTSSVTNMSYMFYQCASLTSLDLTSFDTGKATNMNCMFNSCTKLATIYATQNKWSTSQTGTAGGLKIFYNCGTSSVTYK